MSHSSSRARSAACVVAAGLVLFAAWCSSGHHSPKASPATVGNVVVSGLPSAESVLVTDAGPATVAGHTITPLSDIYSITPMDLYAVGAVTAPVRVSFALRSVVAAGTPIVAMTRASTGEPWTYLPAVLSSDRRHAQVTTTGLGDFAAVTVDAAGTLTAFTNGFGDAMAGGATASVDAPSCTGQEAARRDGYSAGATSADAVLWCFGAQDGHRVLKVTDRRPYPIEVAHPGLPLLDLSGGWAGLDRVQSGTDTILGPGGTATYDAALIHVPAQTISTTIDGVGQSLYALQAAIAAFASVLSGVDAGATTVAGAADKLLALPSCTATIGKGASAIVAGCLSGNDVVVAFGTDGLLLVPLVTSGSVASIVQNDWAGFVDQFDRYSRASIAVQHSTRA